MYDHLVMEGQAPGNEDGESGGSPEGPSLVAPRRAGEGRHSGETLWLSAAAVVLVGALVLALLGVERASRANRLAGRPAPGQAGPAVEVARDSRDAVDRWIRSGARGRILVHFGRYLHFVEPEPLVPAGSLSAFPFDLRRSFVARADDANFLWVLARNGVARRLVHVLPPESFSERFGPASGDGPPRVVEAPVAGYRRTIGEDWPRLGEPVLLSVDPSALSTPGGLGRWRALRDSGLVVERVVANLAEDNPRIEERSRGELEARVRDWVAGGGVPR